MVIKLRTSVRRPYIVNMDNIYVIIFIFLFYFSPGGAYEKFCSRGEKLHTRKDGRDVCFPCLRGTFIDEENHSLRHCKPCTRIENSDVEVLVSACNSTHDAVILCKSEFYRRRARNIIQKDRCEKCTECPFPARPCEGYYNTVCCPPNHDAVMTPDGVFVCKKRPSVCEAGQFYWTASETCLPCPAGTFMPARNHTYKDCLKCEELSDNNLTQAVITRPCSRTAPTLFGCKAGYFRDPTQESLQIEALCTPCRICNRSLTDCDMFHDAVCEDEHRMVSVVATDLTASAGDGRNVNDCDNSTTPCNSTDVPGSFQVTATQTSVYEINVLLAGEMLLYLLLSCMRVFKDVYISGGGFQLARMLRDFLKLFSDYYLFMFLVLILLRVLIFLYYYGYFGGFAKDNILITVAIVSAVMIVVYLLYLLSDYIKAKSREFWGIICSGKRRIQNSVNRWLNAKKDKAVAIPAPQA